MSAYVISEVEPLDEDKFARYRELAALSIARHGGRYLVRGAEPEIAEGDPADRRRIVIVEFTDRMPCAAGTDPPTTPMLWPCGIALYAAGSCSSTEQTTPSTISMRAEADASFSSPAKSDGLGAAR